MSNLPDSSTSERLSRIVTDQRAVRQQLASLGVLRLHSATGSTTQVVFAAGWQAVEGVANVWMRALAPPAEVETCSDYFETRFSYGASCQDASVPQAGRTTILAGALLWWQARRGPDPVRLDVGDVVHLEPGEAHSYTALEDTWCLVRLTPRLCDDLPLT